MSVVPRPVRLKRWLQRRAEHQLARRINWQLWRSAKMGHPLGDPVILYRQGQRMRARASGRTKMPEVFCLDRNPDETVRFLASMRQEILGRAVEAKNSPPRRRRPGPPVVEGYFDFSTIKTLGVSAALVLASLYDRQKKITGWRLSTINEHDWSPEVLAVFHAVGFHELLEMRPSRGMTVDVADYRILRFVSGNKADGSQVGTLQEALAALLPQQESQKLLYAEPYGGIFEAVLNSSTWAYPAGQEWPEAPALEKWWMTGAVDLRDNIVSLAVYDQGVTIPVSLPRWTHYGQLEERLQRLAIRLGFTGEPGDVRNDGAAIALASKISRSSTNLPQHGKGLHTMLEVAQRARHGRLRILSRNGEYVWEKGRRSIISSRPDSIGGTLVEWTLYL